MQAAFEPIRRLSNGASAEVVLARSNRSLNGVPTAPEEVILEVFRRELISQPDLVGRFVNEASLRRKLTHPHVARRVASGQTPDGRLFLVTEPVSSQTLRSWLREQGPLNVTELARLMLPLCDALAYLHERGLVHLNLTPAHVFLPGGLRAFNPKLFDCSLSLLRGGRATTPGQGRPLVEAEYMAPERLSGRRGDARADIYSLGVLMYEALTGAPPFAGTPRETLSQIHRFPPEPLQGTAAVIESLLHLCLKPDPGERLQSAAAVAEALRSLPQGHTWTPPSTERERTPRPMARLEQVGDMLGNYQLLQPLGQGGMGRVFLAQHTLLQRQVALKLMLPQHVMDRGLVRRFFQEARAANHINHEHIVEIYDFVDECEQVPPRVYCVMEVLKGKSLGELLRGPPLSLARGLNIVRQLCTALGAAHQAGVIHRDVKPDNIFVTERAGVSDFVKVLDFGVAKLVRAETDANSGVNENSIVGTPSYMAPEQALGERTDHRADIFSVGVLLYRMLQGSVPLSGAIRLEQVRRGYAVPPLPLSDRTPAGEFIPAPLKQIVMRCLETEVEKRPTSMDELRSLLGPYALPPLPGGTEAPTPTPLPVISAPPRLIWRPGKILLGVGLMGVLALAGLGGHRYFTQSPAVVPAQPVLPIVATPPVAPYPLSWIRLTVQSHPQGAKVFWKDSGSVLGETPLTLQVERRTSSVTLVLQQPGGPREERTVQLERDTTLQVNFPGGTSAANTANTLNKSKRRVIKKARSR